MTSPLRSGEVSQGSRCTTPIKMSSKQLPSTPRRSHFQQQMASPASSKSVEKRGPSPSLVQFSFEQKPPRFHLNAFSILRLTLLVANFAGLGIGIAQARSTEPPSLQPTVLCFFFLSFSVILSILDLVQFHYSKLPYRVEAMLDLLLAFAFLMLFIVGVLVHVVASDAIYFAISVLHFLSYFNTLIRAHRISLQLQHLSNLTFKDIEQGQNAKQKLPDSPVTSESTPTTHIGSNRGDNDRRKTTTETITAIRSPCIELEGSSRWTIVSEKSP